MSLVGLGEGEGEGSGDPEKIVTMLTTPSQRWRERRWPATGEIDPKTLVVDVIDTRRQATPFVERHHYAASMPVACLSVGLFRNGSGRCADLVGVCVFSRPSGGRVRWLWGITLDFTIAA